MTPRRLRSAARPWLVLIAGLVLSGAIRYGQRVPRAQLDAVEARIRSAGRPEFTAERLGQKPEVFLVTEIEPLAHNRAALGKDVGAGTTRRGAAEQAMRTGAPVITHRIGLLEGARTEPR